jgi:hypothetical protein
MVVHNERADQHAMMEVQASAEDGSRLLLQKLREAHGEQGRPDISPRAEVVEAAGVALAGGAVQLAMAA